MEIHVKIKDDKAELFINILKEFKEDMVEDFQILETKKDKLQEIEGDLRQAFQDVKAGKGNILITI